MFKHESLLHDIIEGRMRGEATRGKKSAPAEQPDERKVHLRP